MLNTVVLIGRLTKDPELRYTPSGVAVAQFTLAVDRPFTNNEGKKEVDFIPVVTWRELAETVANHLQKGRLVAVEGRIQVRNYENNEGKRVYVTEIIASGVRFLDYPKDSDQNSNQNNNQNQNNNASQNKRDPFVDDGKPIDISDDDLPF